MRRQNKPMVQCPRWPPPAPEPSQRQSEGLPAQECELCCAWGWALPLAPSQPGGYAALGTLPCVRSVGSLCQEAATQQHPLLRTLGSEPLSIRGARRPSFCPPAYLKALEIRHGERSAWQDDQTHI